MNAYRPALALIAAVSLLGLTGCAVSDKTTTVQTSASAYQMPIRLKHPNIVIILADDMGWRDVGYHGSEIKTPNIDALAAKAVILDRYYAQPSCSPTRSALMTGRSPMRLGVVQPLSKITPTGLPLREKLLPQYLKDANYQTFLTGKWHLGDDRRPIYPVLAGLIISMAT